MLAGIEFILNRNMRHHWMAFLLLSFSKRNVCFCKWIHFLLILYLSKERKGKKNTVIVNSSLCYYAAPNWDGFWKSSDRRPLSSGTKSFLPKVTWETILNWIDIFLQKYTSENILLSHISHGKKQIRICEVVWNWRPLPSQYVLVKYFSFSSSYTWIM